MNKPGQPVRVLIVCLGNICRSPLAEGVFAHQVAEAGLNRQFISDSAGTGSWHIGNPPDPRSVAAAAWRGIDLSAQRARQVSSTDFSSFDHILAMDDANLATLMQMAPEQDSHKLRLFLDGVPGIASREVPDPYYGGDDGFEEVLDLIEQGSRALLNRLT